MLRKVFVASLSAALVFATSPGFACTGISLKAEDGAAIRARTLEFGFPMQSNVLIVPPGQEFSGTLPDGGKGLTIPRNMPWSAPTRSTCRSFSMG